MDLASLYIILGSISFTTSVVTLGILIKKFIDQPAAHGFFVYSDTMASGLLSLGLLLDTGSWKMAMTVLGGQN